MAKELHIVCAGLVLTIDRTWFSELSNKLGYALSKMEYLAIQHEAPRYTYVWWKIQAICVCVHKLLYMHAIPTSMQYVLCPPYISCASSLFPFLKFFFPSLLSSPPSPISLSFPALPFTHIPPLYRTGLCCALTLGLQTSSIEWSLCTDQWPYKTI